MFGSFGDFILSNTCKTIEFLDFCKMPRNFSAVWDIINLINLQLIYIKLNNVTFILFLFVLLFKLIIYFILFRF